MIDGNTKFSEATKEQFMEFFEEHGLSIFRYREDIIIAYRVTKKNRLDLNINPSGNISVEAAEYDLMICTCETFHEALSVMDELAATKAFGGWA